MDQVQEKIATAIAEKQDFDCLCPLYQFLDLVTFVVQPFPPGCIPTVPSASSTTTMTPLRAPAPPIVPFNHGHVHFLSVTLPQGVRTEGVATQRVPWCGWVTYRTSRDGEGGDIGGGGGRYGEGNAERGLRADGRRRFFISLIADDRAPRTITACRALSPTSLSQHLHAHVPLALGHRRGCAPGTPWHSWVSSTERHGASTFSLLAEVPLTSQPRRRNLRLQTVPVPLGACRAQRKSAVRVSSTLRCSPLPRSLAQHPPLLLLTILLILTIPCSAW